jgi:hypothetical protein
MIPFKMDYFCRGIENHILYIESNIFHTFCYSEHGDCIFNEEDCSAVKLVDFIFNLREGKYGQA